jgi:AraC family transcriptional regulator of adaptative response/methylated-DNA-[protein]-cysteine methyltransferase
MLGMAPQSYRRRGQDQRIRCPGRMLAGQPAGGQHRQGVCCVLLGDDPHALVDDLQQRFAAAQLIGADARYEQTVAQVVALMEQPGWGGPAAGYSGHGVSAACVAGAAEHSGRQDCQLQ